MVVGGKRIMNKKKIVFYLKRKFFFFRLLNASNMPTSSFLCLTKEGIYNPLLVLLFRHVPSSIPSSHLIPIAPGRSRVERCDLFLRCVTRIPPRRFASRSMYSTTLGLPYGILSIPRVSYVSMLLNVPYIFVSFDSLATERGSAFRNVQVFSPQVATDFVGRIGIFRFFIFAHVNRSFATPK